MYVQQPFGGTSWAFQAFSAVRESETFVYRLPHAPSCIMLVPHWGSFHRAIMQRLMARILLLFAVVGAMLPIALQATAAPVHACCRRSGAHHCVDSPPAHEPIVRNTGCCRGDCSRAVTTAQWAHPQPPTSAVSTQPVVARAIDWHAAAVSTLFSSSRSPRAPPAC